MDENCAARANVDTSQLRRGKTIEQIYQKKTQLEHILLRPDTYVGSTEHQLQDMWVFDELRGEMEHRKIDYVPALYKIFDEILVNAADNSMRDPKGMDLMEVNIDRQQGCISVMNNGKGVPVQIHKEHNCYVPEMIFGQLLTSDNYDDAEKKVTGGRNGYGAKLTNVFSKKFTVETADKTARKKFLQIYEQNMSKKGQPVISDHTGPEYTRITFWPDFARFGMTGLDNDITGLMMKRVYDMAGSTNSKVRVVLNGKQLRVKNFQDYMQLYVKPSADTPIIYERCGERWEIAMSITEGSFQQVSFVNSINTIKGGTHVSHVSDQLVEAILKVVKGKNRGGIEVKPAHVRNHMWVFINALIENPAFDSQTKETLTTKQSKFGSSCEVPERMLKQVLKSGIVEIILDWVKAKQKVDLSRQMRSTNKNTTRILGIPKLEDANDAGGRNSSDCTLILTEGDSAKSLAVAGLSVVGRDKYGVFPLKGKVLNVRDANYKQVSGNAEIQNILKIMGLDLKAEYNDTNKLRYGSLMLMTDQDHDGSHIKGLLINLVHHWWPSLIRMDGFLKEFITPIVKVWKPGGKDSERKEETSFFTVNEFESWKTQHNDGRGWKSKYYKGLGTSTMKEAKEYFRDIEIHEKSFSWSGEHDGESIDLAFNKKRADDRKDWINAYEEGTNVDHTKKKVGYHEFIHKELVQFAKYDVSRSIPCIVDGFKCSQRKVIFSSFKKKLKNDIKVAQFVGYISEQSAYHHGEVSLENTIVNLAQNFVGANNVNLLVPSGQFGTRLQGGKDHAAARYIYTRLHGTTRMVFHPDDDAVLEYLDEEGLSIEPKWYCPILPTVLVNGGDGIGVGWSTCIPNYDPRECIRNIRRMLRGMSMEEMHPWYKGFRGSITPSAEHAGKYVVMGVAQKKSDTLLEISELPVKKWTQDYKEFLEELMPKEKKADDDSDHWIEDFREYHTENNVHFELQLTPAKMREAEKAGFDQVFKLKGSLPTTNMVLFDAEGKLAKYGSALDILTEFCSVRLEMYNKRKGYLVAKLTREKEILSNKARFILMVVKGELELRKKKKADLLRELKQLGFTPMSKLNAILAGKGGKGGMTGGVDGEDDEGTESTAKSVEKDADGVDKTEYDYLLGMNLWSLTYEKVEEIKKQFELKKAELEVLEKTTIEQMWDRDLEALSVALDEGDAMEAEEAAFAVSAAQGRKRKKGGKAEQHAPPSLIEASRSKPPLVRRGDDSFLSRPLASSATCSRICQKVQKQTWGGDGDGSTPAQRVTTGSHSGVGGMAQTIATSLNSVGFGGSGLGNIGGVAGSTNSGGGSGKSRGKGRPAPAAQTVSASRAPPPPQDTSAAGLLSRLLNKKPDEPSFSSNSSHATPIQIGGDSEDLFAYLRPGNKPAVTHGGSSVGMPSRPRERSPVRPRERSPARPRERSPAQAGNLMDLTGGRSTPASTMGSSLLRAPGAPNTLRQPLSARTDVPQERGAPSSLRQPLSALHGGNTGAGTLGIAALLSRGRPAQDASINLVEPSRVPAARTATQPRVRERAPMADTLVGDSDSDDAPLLTGSKGLSSQAAPAVESRPASAPAGKRRKKRIVDDDDDDDFVEDDSL